MEEESMSRGATSICGFLRIFWIFHSWELLCIPCILDWCPKLFLGFIDHITSFWHWLKRFLALYWKSLTVLIVPIALLPIILMDDKPENRCLYVLLLVGIFWSTVALPIPVTSMLPVILFPTLGILSTNETCEAYMSEENMSFISELIIALTVQHCNLHKRVALKIISVIGCSQRKLNFGLISVTMFISMWIPNSVAMTTMVPIIKAVLEGLENEGVCKLYIDNNDPENHERSSSWHHLGHSAKKPSKITMCYFMGAAFVTSIGSCGSLLGSGTNFALKYIYENKFTGQKIDNLQWMCFNVPLMLINTGATWLYLQWYFMGLFRVTSDEAIQYNLGNEGKKIVKKVIAKRYNELGPISQCEIQVALLLVVGIILYILNSALNSGFKEAPFSLLIVVALFALPANWNWLKFLTGKSSEFPRTRAQSLITWRYINRKLPWSLFFLLGCGFALARGSKASGMSKMLGSKLSSLGGLPFLVLLFLICLFTQIITEFISSIAIVNVILPILAELAISIKVHPLFLMYPSTISCSMGFHTIFGTPHNLIAAEVANIRTKDIAIAGLGPSIFSLLTIWAAFPTWGRVIYPEIGTFPSWANVTTSNDNNLINQPWL
ncbi:protein I'm not dead yet-like [Sitodiplosis mosellana]|uniref:protein I'm not dead yet-like n=1 Tax=Sitodiplosis mosellana TaxID=263140 RepID=UPI0024448089|nr:protein I'm not dead yet-like [Sitodiplosis mosellana]